MNEYFSEERPAATRTVSLPDGPPSEEQKSLPQEIDGFSPQDIEDLQWPTTRKGWPQYWAKRLGHKGNLELQRDVNTLTKALREYVKTHEEHLVDQYLLQLQESSTLTDREIEDLRWHEGQKGWIDYWEKRIGTTLRQEDIKKKIFPILIKKAEKNGVDIKVVWEKFIRSKGTEKKEKRQVRTQEYEVLARESDEIANHTDETIASYVEHYRPDRTLITDSVMTEGTKAVEYWMKRCATELAIVPPHIQDIVRAHARGEVISQKTQYKFQKYMNDRVAVARTQLDKQKQMYALKKELHAIDEHEELSNVERLHRRELSYDQSKEMLYVSSLGGPQVVTEGDIVADFDWGIEYMPNNTVPPKLWRRIRKLSAIKKARSAIFRAYNTEIARAERIALPTTTVSVEDLKRDMESNDGIHGIIAEKMSQGLLIRLSYNHPDVGISVEPSNALEDAELKYDFKLVVSQRRRGVAIEGEDLPRDEYVKAKRRVGVQLTVRHHAGRKTSQIQKAREDIHNGRFADYVKKRVDDVVLVQVPLTTYRDYFKRWLTEGSPSGGPEQYMTKEEKLFILTRVTKGIANISSEELEAFVE
jgi:hypothetical protein